MLCNIPMLVMTLGATVVAQNTAPANLPLNAQDGAVHFPIVCKFESALNDTFSGLFTATAPVYGGLGQQIYYTEATAQITVPSNVIFDLAPLVGITQTSALVHVALQITNAQPANVPVFPNGLLLQNISVPFNQDVVVNVPGNGGVIPPIGPITLGNKKRKSIFYMGEIDILLNLQNAQGQTVISNLSIVCPVQNPDIVLGVVNVQLPAGQPPLSIDSGGAGSFPPVASNYEVGSFRFPYSCTFGGYGTYNLDLSITGTVKTYVAPGEQFYLNNVTAFLRVDSPVISQFKSKNPSLSSVRTTVNSFYVGSTFATPSKINALSAPLTYTNTSGSGEFTIPIPESGVLQVGPITASTDVGYTSYLRVLTSSAALQLLSASGAILGNVHVSCRPITPLSLIGFPITNQTPGQT